jgi:hypothetical protein
VQLSVVQPPPVLPPPPPGPVQLSVVHSSSGLGPWVEFPARAESASMPPASTTLAAATKRVLLMRFEVMGDLSLADWP